MEPADNTGFRSFLKVRARRGFSLLELQMLFFIQVLVVTSRSSTGAEQQTRYHWNWNCPMLSEPRASRYARANFRWC